jgi:hypothetical protein
VYKTEVDALKYDFNHAFGADEKRIKDSTYLNIDHKACSESDNALYWAIPYEVRHYYGKKFSDFLVACDDSPFKDGIVSHRNRWKPLFDELQALIARQVKGRRPPEPKNVIGTRTQLRAVCPICFRMQAVRGVRMVAHGYTLDYGYQNGVCSGEGKPHFGTEEGRDITKKTAESFEVGARSLRANAPLALTGEILPRDRKTFKTIENPTQDQKQALHDRMIWDAQNDERYATQLNLMVANWTPQEAIEVTVDITE